VNAVEGRWRWSDAWVLTAACVVGTNPVTLPDLIGAGDYINHAILLDEEINDAVARLDAVRLVRVEDDELAVTAEGSRLYDEATASIRTILEATDAVNRALNRLELPAQIPRTIGFSSAALNAAKERYRDEPLPEG
jgi:hypothetical protein